MSTAFLSRHAGERANQRGVTHQMIAALIAHADVEVPAGGGCTAIRFSRGRLADRGLRALLGGDADRLGSVALVLGETGAVVTVLHDRGGAAGRRYRRAH